MATYTHGYHDSVLRSHRVRTVANSAAYLADALRPGTSVLDVGCGPGTITVDIAERVAPGPVVAVEPTDATLVEPRALAVERGLANARFEAADVHALPYDNGDFELVHAHQVLQHVVDPVRALREMRRVCAPGGVVAARDADYAAMTWYPEVPELTRWLSLYRAIARANGGEPDAGRRLLSWARAAGFADIEPSASTWCYATPAARDWWAGVWSARIVDSAVATQAVSDGYATRAELRRIADGWRRWAAADDGWFVIVHGEVRCRP